MERGKRRKVFRQGSLVSLSETRKIPTTSISFRANTVGI